WPYAGAYAGTIHIFTSSDQADHSLGGPQVVAIGQGGDAQTFSDQLHGGVFLLSAQAVPTCPR
ncbi:MAG TPA: hypothetical protein PLA97_11815, partial [Rubrivivax sp.]|nr:hypothetical protein [Rubrivivax sp.]